MSVFQEEERSTQFCSESMPESQQATVVSGMGHLGEIMGGDKGRGEARGQMGLLRASMQSHWRALTTRVA